MDQELIELIQDQISATKKFITVLSINDWTNTEYMLEKIEGATSPSLALTEYLEGEEDSDKYRKEQQRRKSIKMASDLYTQEYKIIDSIVDKRNSVLDSSKGFHNEEVVIEFYNECSTALEIHFGRVRMYIDSEKSEDIAEDIKQEEINLMMLVNNGQFKMKMKVGKAKLETEFETGTIRLHDNTPVASLIMIDQFLTEFPHLKDKLDDMGIDLDPEVDDSIHLYNKNAPIWNSSRHFFDQDPKTLQYYIREIKKCRVGIYVDGLFIEPWMYFHMNYFKTPIPTVEVINGQRKNNDVVREPPIRDNEWFVIQDTYPVAEKNNLIMFIAATRRFSKSTLIASHLHWKIVIGKRQLLVVSSTSSDLGHITNNMKISMGAVNKAFFHYTLAADWGKDVTMGTRFKATGRLESCIIRMINMEGGADSTSEKLAGFTPDAFVIDEVMKSKFKKHLEAAIPALAAPEGWRCSPILSGCLTAGNKVYTKEGKRINIEDLRFEDGITGFDKETMETSFEDITHINPPQEKECIKITTELGIETECSTDHPFLVDTEWIDAEDLKIGDKLILPNNVPFLGLLELEDAYELGRNIDRSKDITFHIELCKESSVKEFISGVMSVGEPYFESIELAKNIQSLLLRLGVYAVLDISEFGSSINIIDKEEEEYLTDKIVSIEHVGMKPVYNLTTSDTHTYLANGIVTHNTGGNGNLAEDAFSMLKNPNTNSVLPMDWKLFNSRVPEQYRTWREQDFGTFAPGQMSAKTGMIKIESNLSEYLSIESERLSKIKIFTTDWKKSKEIIEIDREKKRSDRLAFIKEIVYFPISPEEIFMSDKVSPFPTDVAREHKIQIELKGDVGRKVRIYNTNEGTIFKDTDDPLPQFPHTGEQIDAPIVLFHDIPNNPPMDLFSSSLDDYKQEKSSTSSLGCFYVMKRQSGNDPLGNTIAAVLTSRPDPHRKFHRDGYNLIKTFNAMCLMENEDMLFKTYLDTLKVADRWLVPTFDLKGNYNISSNANRKYGISPARNRSQIIAAVANYCNEEIEIPDGRGGLRPGLGVERIKDTLLLEELINYNEDLNVDRITAFGICLIQMNYLDANYRLVPTEITKETKKAERPVFRKAGTPFGKSRSGVSAFSKLRGGN